MTLRVHTYIDTGQVWEASQIDNVSYQAMLSGVYGHEQRHVQNIIGYVQRAAQNLSWDLANRECSATYEQSASGEDFSDCMWLGQDLARSYEQDFYSWQINTEFAHVVDEDGPADGVAYPSLGPVPNPIEPPKGFPGPTTEPKPVIDNFPFDPRVPVNIPPDLFK